MIEKKKFFEVEVPVVNKTVDILASAPEQLNNKVVKLDLTRALRGKSIEVIAKISADEKEVSASVTRVHLLPFFIRRMIRPSTSYVEDSFNAECKDAVLKIKFFLITRKKVPRSVRKQLRENARDYIKNEIKSKTADQIFSNIISNKMQKPLSLFLKKTYPLALCEIRDIIVEKRTKVEKPEKKAKVIEEKVEKPEEEKEEVKEKVEEPEKDDSKDKAQIEEQVVSEK